MKRLVVLALFLGLAVLASAVFAQDAEVVASGLNNPRNVFLAEDGTLYIAEAGSGGNTDVQGPYGPAKAGLTAQISAVSPDGEQTVVVPSLISMDAGFGQLEGPTDVYVTEDSYWVVLGMGMSDIPFEGGHVEAVVQIDRESGEVKQFIDLGAFEQANNPDQSVEIVANPADLAVDSDGKLYIVDASANDLMTWTEADGLQLFASWPSADDQAQAVPTAVDIGPDGDIYVGFLSGFPFTPGSARIERYGVDGTLKQTYSDLTLVTDIKVTADGEIYALEMASGFGDTGYIAESGSLIKISDSGVETLVDGLNYPYGFAIEPDGSFLVTVDSAFGAPDSGRVILINAPA